MDRLPAIVFSDMDGTFLTTDKRIGDAAWRALDALAERGIPFVPCTGRPFTGLPAELLAHPAVHHAISANGASVFELDGTDKRACAARTIHTVPLGAKCALAVWDIVRGRDATFDIFAGGRTYLMRSLFDRLEDIIPDAETIALIRRVRTPVDETPEQTIGHVGDIERVGIYWHDPADRDAILAGLDNIPGIVHTRSHPTNIEVMAAGATKGTALRWLCAHLGIDVRDALAFGDSLNDIPMLEAAGAGVAVANAEPATQAAADLVIASNDEGGPAHEILARLGVDDA